MSSADLSKNKAAGGMAASGIAPGKARLVACAAMFVLTLVIFGGVLFTSGSRVISGEEADIFSQTRQFGFDELKRGNLALWNPHIFSGLPYFGGFQSALLYPLNWIYLLLPVAKAMNLGMALHVFLAGVFMYLWAEYRGLHYASSFLSGVLWMFCGAHFLHVYGGHLTALCTIVWAPLIFLAIDGMFRRPGVNWALLGIFSASMQVVAGHPQFVFYTGVGAALYCAFHFISAQQRLKAFAGLFMICVGAVGVVAVQLFAGLAASAESVRSTGVSYEFATTFSFPPENVVTLIAPQVFGGMKTYWARCYLWEMSLFFGVSGLVLATFGAIIGDKLQRRYLAGLALIVFVLALGGHTPLFHVLYDWVPGFDKFRGLSKFTFLSSMFLILLAGVGFDALLKKERIPLKWAIAPAAAGLMIVFASLWLRYSDAAAGRNGAWQKFTEAIVATKEVSLPPHVYDHPAFLSLSLQQAAKALLIGGTTLLVVSVLLLLALRRRTWLFALVLLGVVEVLVFARNSLGGFDLETVESADFRRFVKENRSDNRIHYVDNANNAMSSGIYDIWGYDPGVMLRYARFMAFSQGFSPDRADVYTPITRASPLLRLLRCQYFLKDQGEKLNVTRLPGEPLQRFQLIRTYKIEPQRDRMLAALTHPEFDLAHEIILETEPDPQPQPDGEIEPGDIRILDSSTDHFTMEANLSAPAILLITDSFSKHWKARPLINGTQTSYEVMPANYCLQAIPLAAGKHHFRVEYLPAGFVVGKWISIISTMAFFGAVVWVVRRKGCRSREAGSACAPAE